VGVGGKETLLASATHSHTLIFTKNLNMLLEAIGE
jgi:hypothetical protein